MLNGAGSIECHELVTKLAIGQLGLLGSSPAFLTAVAQLPLLSECDVTVLITGATGTGKELVARALHYLGARHTHPFVPVDCAAIPRELVESELFGHERGAFTGAVSRSIGLIGSAQHGTLFLDEVDALPPATQAKLLRFLQQREYRRVGSVEIREADVRMISATNHDLRKDVEDGVLREDLFYRLAVVQLSLPALRERAEDIPMLAGHFLARYARQFNRPARAFSGEVLERLLLDEWPGNIRQLENVIQAAVAMCDGTTIEMRHIPSLGPQPRALTSFREAKAAAIAAFEREYLLRLLRVSFGNISRAARMAKKHRRAFWELLRKHHIQSNDYSNRLPENRKGPQRAPAPEERYTSKQGAEGA